MIKFENVSKTYDGRKYVLNDFNLEIGDGEFVFIMGPSGAGKTTFTKLLLREEKLSEGRIYFDKYKLHKLPDRKVPYLRRKMGFVFQDFRLFQNKTVYENVAFAMEVLGEPNKIIKKRVPIALDIVGLTGKEKVMPKELSGGEKQRLCVARAIVNNPSVIVADEPTGNLDFKLAKEIMDLLVKITEYGKTVIVVTHAKDLVEQYDKRVVTIESGRIVSDTMGLGGAEYNPEDYENIPENSDYEEVSFDDFIVENNASDESVSNTITEKDNTSTEIAKELFPDEDGIREGNSLFENFISSFTGSDDTSDETSDNGTDEENVEGVYDEHHGAKADNNANESDAASSGELTESELINLQTELLDKRNDIQNKISAVLADGKGDDNEENQLSALRKELDKIADEIDKLDIKLGEFSVVDNISGEVE